jgi:hypothetical protein
VKPTEFSYREKQFGSFIERIVQAGYTRQADGRYLMRAPPPLDLSFLASQGGTSLYTKIWSAVTRNVLISMP